jgi:hypothetical protein
MISFIDEIGLQQNTVCFLAHAQFLCKLWRPGPEVNNTEQFKILFGVILYCSLPKSLKQNKPEATD